MMKNLELKVKIDQQASSEIQRQLQPHYAETLHQTDTYFVTENGRFKLREEKDKGAYLIRYLRPDVTEAKESNYLFYPIEDVKLFKDVLSDSLKEEVKVIKQRLLFLPEPHIRIHLDQVEELGHFLEIEIIISEESSKAKAQIEMKKLQENLQLEKYSSIDCGYRDLLLRQAMV